MIYLRYKMSQEHKLVWYLAIIWTFIYVNDHKHSIYMWKVNGNFKMTSEMSFST